VKLHELEEDIVGLAEVQRKGENQFNLLKSGNMFYFIGTKNGKNGGVGFLIKKKGGNDIVEIQGASDRIAKIDRKLNNRCELQIKQVYAPTSSYSDDEVETFYNEMQKLHDGGKAHYKIIRKCYYSA